MMTKSFRKFTYSTFLYLVLIIGLIILLIPFFWMLSTALKDRGDIFTYPPQWIPRPVIWHNFIDAINIYPFIRYSINSFKITFSCIIGVLLSSSLVAFGFARIKFPGRDLLFIILLSTLMLPPQVTMVPLFILFQRLGWIDTFKPLIVPVFFVGGFGNAFNVFLLRQFFSTIPYDLDDAARIDGASTFQIYYLIILPLAKPALIIVAILAFMYHWNDFMWPLIVINSMEKFTVPLGLNAFKGSYVTDWNLLMAAAVIALLPCVILFFLAQKYFVRGVVLTGLKR